MSGTQFDIVCHELVIGTLWKAVLSVTAGQSVTWRWTFHITAGPPSFEHHGRAETLEDAKAEIERNWQAWVGAAGFSENG